MLSLEVEADLLLVTLFLKKKVTSTGDLLSFRYSFLLLCTGLVLAYSVAFSTDLGDAGINLFGSSHAFGTKSTL